MFDFFRKQKSWKQPFQEGMTFGSKSDFKKAEESFRRAIRLAPEEPYPHYELGYTLCLVGRHEEALEEFETTNRLARGFFLVQTEAYISKQILSGGINEAVLGMLRKIQRLSDINTEQFNEEIASLSQEVIAVAPECALGHFYLGKALMGADQVSAEQALKQCLELRPDETTAINAKFHLGILSRDRGDERTAHSIWSAIVADYNGNPHTRFAEMMCARKPN